MVESHTEMVGMEKQSDRIGNGNGRWKLATGNGSNGWGME
jgi:hypothetical protein